METIKRKIGKWSKQEDELLLNSVRQYGAKDWPKISTLVVGRNSVRLLLPKIPKTKHPNDERFITHTQKQCRDRWSNHLDPRVKTDPWTSEEDDKIRDLHLQFGNHWSKIAKKLPGRTGTFSLLARTENSTQRFKNVCNRKCCEESISLNDCNEISSSTESCRRKREKEERDEKGAKSGNLWRGSTSEEEEQEEEKEQEEEEKYL